MRFQPRANIAATIGEAAKEGKAMDGEGGSRKCERSRKWENHLKPGAVLLVEAPRLPLELSRRQILHSPQTPAQPAKTESKGYHIPVRI